MGYLTEPSRQKSCCEFENILVLPSVYFYDLFIKNFRKLVSVSNPIMENIPVSFSLFRLGFLSISFSFTFYLFHSLFLLIPHFSCCEGRFLEVEDTPTVDSPYCPQPRCCPLSVLPPPISPRCTPLSLPWLAADEEQLAKNLF